ncbi:DUF6541 family protein [Trueperella bialowiezensis]|uniref:Uncharacterized protein n=1 Tax=Trueperella bialowiezensis TaxID=312285 RepID=A0A3S4WFT4_9ACTO|nr:DUF6541 family protein [Trueperella bialowiezensis]VEI12919.1 Uncharacterised protein [Trueperella bialowiezensis]
MITSWIPYLPLVAVLFAVVYLPGYGSLRILGLSRATAANVAPAVTFAIVGVSAMVAGLAGLRWGWAVFVGATVMSLLVALTLRPLFVRLELGRLPEIDVAPRATRAHRISLALTLLFLIVPIVWLADPWAPSVQADPMFHYNTANAVVKTGDASMLSAIAPSYGITALPTVYPTVWHAIVALTGEQLIMPASHLLAYVVVPTIWVFGADYLTRQLFPTRPRVWVAAPLTIAVLPYFPNFLTVSRGFWPNSLALAAMPAAAGVVIAWLRILRTQPRQSIVQTALAGIAIFGVSLLGLGLAHPGAVFALLWPVTLPLAIRAGLAIFTAIRFHTFSRDDRLAMTGAGAFALLVLALFSSEKVRDFFGRSNPRSWDFAERFATLGDELASFSTPLVVAGVVVCVGLLVACAAVVVQVWQISTGRWLVLAWTAQWLALIGAYVDSSIFSAIAGIWYHDPKRIMAVQGLITGLIVALWIERASSKLNPVAVFACGAVATIALGIVLRIGNVYQDAQPAIGEGHPIDSQEELDLLKNLDSLVPPGSLVVGDPTTGIGYAPAYGDVNVVFPQVNSHPKDADGQYLIANFSDIHTDPHVCTILTNYGIRYYYEDDPLVYQKRDRSETWPGFYEVDTARGFTKIAETDGGSLWQIDACGPIPEPDWWDIQARRTPLPTTPSAE